MSQAGQEPHSSRALADILREAGVSAAGAGGRRRRRDDGEAEPPGLGEDTGAGEPVRDPPAYDGDGLSSYLLSTDTPARDDGRAQVTPPLPEPEEASNRRVPTAPPRTDTGPVPTQGWVTPGTGTTTRTVSEPDPRPAESSSMTAPAHANRSSSPLATAPAENADEEDSAVGLPSGALSWAILGIELLAAVGLGVAAWFAFSALWDLLPYVAALVGPLVVTGLVAVAGALRSRTGRNPLGLPTLCILVFAGTVLVVVPAATLIVP